MTAPTLGDIVYLASYVFNVQVLAQSTMTDTPNQYTAKLGVMGDQGAMTLDALQGQQGADGQAMWQLRLQKTPAISDIKDLPDLTDTPEDIGKYWQIDELDPYGHIIGSFAWVWYGTSYVRTMMGSFGPPGPIPNVEIEVEPIEPGTQATVDTGGGTIDPSWVFKLPSPAGPPGKPGLLFTMNDFDSTLLPSEGDVVGFTGFYNESGQPVWGPVNLDQILPAPFSMPESAFSSYSGVSQQANIGSFVIPTQTYAYIPIVWGHIGGAGVNLSSDPFMIGCEVLLGDPVNGIQIARGLGNTGGEVNITPHYSSSGNTEAAISPNNGLSVIPANNGDAALATLYINLWNDGQLGIYTFSPADAQLFVMLLPVNPTLYPTFTTQPQFGGTGSLSATATKG